MGESAISSAHVDTPSTAAASTSSDASQKLSQDNNNMSFGTKAERIGQVTLEGLADTPLGAVHAVEHDLSPDNWAQTAAKVGTAGLMGVAMRTLLPESGAVKTIAGLAMGSYFLADGAKPMISAWKNVASNSGDEAMQKSASAMGDGLGAFGVDGYMSMKVANFAGDMTPGIAQKIAPDKWNALEAFKNEHLSGTSPLISPLTNLTGNLSTAMKGFANKLDPQGAKEPAAQLSPEVVRQSIADSNEAGVASQMSENMYRHGIAGSDGNTHGLDRTANLLLSGEDPNTVPAGAGPIDSQKIQTRFANQDFVQSPGGILIPESFGNSGKLTAEPLDGTQPTKSTDATATTGAGAGNQTEASRILNATTMGQMASVIRAHLAATSDEQGLMMDQINRNVGAVDVRTDPSVKPLQGYDDARAAMINLAQQAGDDPNTYRQVSGLFGRFSAAALQSGARESGPTGQLIPRFNAYARENLATWTGNMKDVGIDPDVALRRKVSAPLGEVTSDVEPMGVDKNGNTVYAHEGPHTVRAIYGPNGEAIWPVDLVKIPIREIDLRGVLTAPIYAHEFLHDESGRMDQFDPEVREAKLNDIAKKVLGPDADKPVNVPNAGVAPQDVLLNNITRQASRIESNPDQNLVSQGVSAAQQKEMFLEGALQRTPEDRVIAAARAAQPALGQNADTLVNVPGTGKMPLVMFVGNVAGLSDERLPSDVLKEAQAHQESPATRPAIEANVDKMLGQSANAQIPLADGTRASLKDVVMAASDATRMPEFNTYDEPIPATNTMTDVLTANAKSIADEFWADLGAAAESGQTAAPYFQALREGGKLADKSVMGQEMRSPENPLGMEGHPVDEMRPFIQAALVRESATAFGQHDQTLLDWADAMEKYADASGSGGDITYASMDQPGQSISIPRQTYINFMRELVKEQLHTPLPRLQGHTLFDIMPDLRKNFRTNDDLSNQWVSAMENNQGPETLDSAFDKNTTKMTNVYGAGQMAFLKMMANNPDADPIAVNDKINQFSDYFGSKYIDDNPHAPQTGSKFQINKQTLQNAPAAFTSQIGSGLRFAPQAAQWVGENNNSLVNAGGSLLFQDASGLRQPQSSMFQ